MPPNENSTNTPASNRMNEELQGKLDAIKTLLGLFKVERMIYISVTLLALVVLLSCAVFLLIKGDKTVNNITPILAMFGSSGAITFTLGRLLKMWSDALAILSPITKEKKNDE